MNKQYKFGAILSYLGIIIGIVSGLLYTPWMVRAIGKSDYGLYGLATSLIGMFLIDLGLSNAVTKFVAQYRAEKKQDQINHLINMIVKLYLLISAVLLVIFTVVFFSLESIYTSLTAQEMERFRVIFIICVVYMTSNFFFTPLVGILNAYEKFIQLKICDLIGQLLNVVLTVTALLMGVGIYALVGAHLLSAICVISLKLYFVFKHSGIKLIRSNFDKELFKSVFSFSVWVTVISLAQRLIINISPSILARVAGTAAISLFNIGAVLEQYSFSVTNSINSMFIAKLSEKVYNSDEEDKSVLPVMIRVGRYQCFVCGLILVGFAVIGKQFVNCWMGPDFENAYWIVLLLITPSYAYVPKQIGITAITVTNNIKYEAFVTIIVGTLNLILSYFLSSALGAVGAALSIFVVYSIRNILIDIVLKKKIGIDMLRFYKKTYLRTFAVQILVMAIAFACVSMIKVSGWMGVSINGCLVAGIYCVGIWFFALNKEEKNLFSGLLLKRKQR